MIAVFVVAWVAAMVGVVWWGYAPDRPLRRSRDSYAAAVSQALSVANGVDYDALWDALIDPDSPDYNALAEWAHNLNPELRKAAVS